MQLKDKLEQYSFVIRQLVAREIKRKYARSNLGILWSVLNPLLSMIVMSLIFSTIFKGNIENFPIYYLIGTIFWSLFTGVTNSAMTALVDNKSLLIKVKLPRVIFPLSRAITALVNFLYSCIAFLLILLFFRIQPTWSMLLFPLYTIQLFFFGLGIGYVLSVLYVFFGDIAHLYSVVLTIWMYMSAIFYPVERTNVWMQELIIRNPVYNYIACARKSIMYGTYPTTEEWLRLFIWSIGVYAFGKLYFDRMQNKVTQKS